MRFTFPRNDTAAQGQKQKYLFGAIKLLVLIVIAAAVTAFRCGGSCGASCVCQETNQVTVKLKYQGQDITDLQFGATANLYVGNADGTTTFLDQGLLSFGGANGNSSTVNLQTPIPKENMVDANGNVRTPPDASFATWDDKLCSTQECGAGRRYRYLILQPPSVDYDPQTCGLILTFNTQKICTFCP